MTRLLRESLSLLALATVLLVTSAAQPKRVHLGEEKAAALDAMLRFLYPNMTTYWDTDVFVQAADGTRTRIAATYVIKLADAGGPEFVAAISEWDTSEKDLAQIRRGNAVSAKHPEYLVAVARDSTGAFRLVTSYALEPNHMFTIINKVDNDPDSPSAVRAMYTTIDFYQGRIAETSWVVLLDANLMPLQKVPIGIEIKEKPSGKSVQFLYVSRTPNGILVTDPVANRKVELPCPEICELSPQDLIGNK